MRKPPLGQDESSVPQGTQVWVKTEAVEAARHPKRRSHLSRTGSSGAASDAGSEILAARPAWPWMPAVLLSSSPKELLLNDEQGQVSLPPTALQDGLVVLDNDYAAVSQTNGSHSPTPTPPSRLSYPDDLITLTHLHEPAVVHCLDKRYNEQRIYTATGPVLLALNPFHTIRGLYGESAMRKYWELAESSSHTANNKKQLPPHVYAIADKSFRNMMRQLDMNRDVLPLDKPTTTTTTTTLVNNTSCCDQSILVSGESGAGKTVTTKYVMKYLAALSQRQQKESNRTPVRAYKQVQQQQQRSSPPKSANRTPSLPSWALNRHTSSSPSLTNSTNRDTAVSPTSPRSTIDQTSIESQVLQSNPILESFGNARTLRNDNSSRFGKFLQLQFHSTGRLLGASIETYLLEKVRLITQAPGERNYHVFYELLFGMDKRELRQYGIASKAVPQDFRLLHSSGTYDRRDGVKDAETYKELRNALRTMKFDVEAQCDLFATVAAVLHAANLTFTSVDDDHEAALEVSNVHLEPVCSLFGVTTEALNEALCSFHIKAGREEGVRRARSQLQAEKGLEALLKATYGALFSFLVRTINDSIAFHPEEHEHDDHGHASKPAATISILDIFGFESFAKNSFEQLCINYCNEALQQQFNAFVLKNEQEEYEREGIEWSFIEFPENKDVLELIDKRSSGILSILDDQCRAPGTTDRTFANGVYNKCRSHKRFGASHRQTAALQFAVHHYAGPVQYTAEGFVEKNRDELPKESIELLLGSKNAFVRHLAEILMEQNTAPATSESNDVSAAKTHLVRRTDSSTIGRMTVGGQFRRQLRDLRTRIDQTSPHYIRCLKPNDNLVPDFFDAMVVAEQLRCGGILEAVRVSRAGFTQHYPHADFVRRYGALAPREVGNAWKESSSLPLPAFSGGGWTSPSPRKKWDVPARGGTMRGDQPFSSKSPSTGKQNEEVDYKKKCKDLLKVLYRKIQRFEKSESEEHVAPEAKEEKPSVPPSVKAKSFSSPSTPSPSWATKSKVSTPSSSTSALPRTATPVWATHSEAREERTTPTPTPTYRSSSSFRRGLVSGGDLAKVGIQMGKTKVFLRHKAFETLERLRSRNQIAAATRLNAIFRMYLARIAYIPVRDAFREEMRNMHKFSTEPKEDHRDPSPVLSKDRGSRRSVGDALHLIKKYESEVRASMHLTPQGLFLKEKSAKPARVFRWVLVEGVWLKNRDWVSS